MECPVCKEDNNRVYKTDDNLYMPFIRRGRICLNCGAIFETNEKATMREYHKNPRDPQQVEMQLDTFVDRSLKRLDRIKEEQEERRATRRVSRKG